jgi:hypothetical protein
MLTKTQSRIKPAVWAAVDPAHPLARGLAGCWLLNEGAGSVARDVTGCRRDGSLSGNPLWSPGSFGSAVEFDGADDWISMGDCLDLGVDDISVLAIIKYSAANQPDNWNGTRIGGVLGKGYLDGSGKGYGLLVETDNRLYWQVRNQANAFAATSDAALNDGRWHLAVGVCDRDDPTGVRLYIDGVLQNATANAMSLNGIDLNGSRAFAIGSRQEENLGTWFWDFAGSVAMACVWKRVLSEAEIRRLQQNPFEMLAPRREVSRLCPGGGLVSCKGSIQAVSSTSATMQVVRPLAGAIGASSLLRGDLRVPGVVSLAGTASGSAALEGSLSVTPARPAFKGMLRTEPTWQLEALFRGRTHAAFELGTALTRGWFWVRRSGCTAVYRGPSLCEVDWSRILCVVEPDAREISLPRSLSHAAGSTECYVVRRFDGCGRQEKTVTAAAVLRIAPDGQSILTGPNGVVGLTGRRIDATCVCLTWFYCPLDQETSPVQFNLYRADASGDVNAGTPIGTVRYKGRGYCRFDAVGPADGQNAFVVRAVSASGVEGRSSVCPVHQIATITPEPAVILAAGPV